MANEPTTNDNSGAAGASGEGNEPVAGAVQPTAGAPAAGDWIPETLKGNKSLSKFKTAGDVAQAYVNLETMLGKRVEIPGDDAPAEAKAAWRAKIGVPDSADKYGNPSLPEGSDIELDGEYLGSFKTKAHELGLSAKQAEALMNWQVAREVAQLANAKAQSEKAKKEGMQGLRTKWGAAADVNVGLVQRLIANTADETVKEALDRTGAGNDPAILGWLARIGGSYAEHDLMEAKDLGTTMEGAKSDIERTLADAKKDRKHPYNDSSHPGHKAEVERVERLYQIAYPDVPFEVNI